MKGSNRLGSNAKSAALEAVNLGEHSGALRIVAFSDYRVHTIELLAEIVSKLQPKADLVLYAGDDIRRFRPAGGENLFEVLASHARYGLCAVSGNDDLPSVRKLIGGKRVFNAHSSPVVIGDYAVLGLEGAPSRGDLEGIGTLLHSEPEIAKHLSDQRQSAGRKKVIILSHAPPEGILDQAQRYSPDGKPHSIGSRSLRQFLHTQKNVAAVVCGHVHRCGGKLVKAGHAVVLNCANHDDEKSVARFAILQLPPTGKPEVEWREIRETAVVPGVGGPSAERLRGIGIRTVEELAAAPLEALRHVPHLGHSRDILRARAQAIVQNKPILLRPPCLPAGPEIFLDIETDLSQGYIWLIGVCVGRGGHYNGFFSETPGGEKGILLEFLEFTSRRPAANILSLSGSEFESRVMSKRLAHYGLPVKACARIVDLHWRLQPSIALPTSSYRVKDVGAYFGYEYRHPDVDGYRVASLYEGEYQRTRKRASGRKLKRMLLQYNEDDVRCLPHILNGIANLAKQLAAPTLPRGETPRDIASP